MLHDMGLDLFSDRRDRDWLTVAELAEALDGLSVVFTVRTDELDNAMSEGRQ